MLIGELAERAHVKARTIRYYESVGLLAEAERSPSGYRTYRDEDAERLRTIRSARAIGLSLDDIRQVLALADSGEAPCGRVMDLLDSRLLEVRRQVAELEQLAERLVSLTTTPAPSAPGPSPRLCQVLARAET